MDVSEEFTLERREEVLAFLGAMEKTRLSREVAGRDDEVCPEWEKLDWPDVLAHLMTGVTLGWVHHFTVGAPDKAMPPIKPDMHYCLTNRGSRAVDAYLRRAGAAPEGG